MEKLIVKNFGPIKEAEIDLTKYVVFIGDTSTGKSVLAKLIAIFRDALFDLAIIKDLYHMPIVDELKRFNINFSIENTEIIYIIDEVKYLELEEDKIVLKFLELKNDWQTSIESASTAIRDNLTTDIKDFNLDNNIILKSIYKELTNRLHSLYMPAERILFTLVGNSLSGLLANNVAMPQCYKEFASKYEVSRKSFNKQVFDSFHITYTYNDGNDQILYNNSKLYLSEASSGIQSMIPLLLVLRDEMESYNYSLNKLLVIEEPEINLFPSQQKKLIEHIIWEIFDRKQSLVITTHSPYILSVLDTLILAKNTFNEHPELKQEINVIVSEDKWIDYNDISVYEVLNDGTIKSLKNEEFKSIDTNAIDRVSDIISEEFDKLTELRYAQ